jgi:hypothetical protein
VDIGFGQEKRRRTDKRNPCASISGEGLLAETGLLANVWIFL